MMEDCCGGQKAAEAWSERPQRRFGGKSPRELWESGGADRQNIVGYVEIVRTGYWWK